METRVVPARVRDAEAILKLQYLCYQTEAALYDDYSISPLTQSFAGLLSEYDTHRILVVRYDEEVVGSVRGQCVDGTCYVGRLCVHPRFQRRGLGAQLMNAIEADCTDVNRYELFTGHRSEQNLRLYRRLGYASFREDIISPHLHLIYLEKYRSAAQ